MSNVVNLVNSPTTLQRIASRVITEENGTPLYTLGPNKRAIIKSPTTESNPIFPGKQLFGIQANLGLSNKQTRVLVQDIRLSVGSRKAVEKGFKECLVQNSHIFDDYFKLVKISYIKIDKDTLISENFEQYTVVCNDLPKLIDLIVEKKITSVRAEILVYSSYQITFQGSLRIRYTSCTEQRVPEL